MLQSYLKMFLGMLATILASLITLYIIGSAYLIRLFFIDLKINFTSLIFLLACVEYACQ